MSDAVALIAVVLAAAVCALVSILLMTWLGSFTPEERAAQCRLEMSAWRRKDYTWLTRPRWVCADTYNTRVPTDFLYWEVTPGQLRKYLEATGWELVAETRTVATYVEREAGRVASVPLNELAARYAKDVAAVVAALCERERCGDARDMLYRLASLVTARDRGGCEVLARYSIEEARQLKRWRVVA